ncbi:MAG: hypothetical protein JOZ41_18875 [Chloroflexi bacterium]|nr:hypothetical protein [Chloroflexota bacterium]
MTRVRCAAGVAAALLLLLSWSHPTRAAGAARSLPVGASNPALLRLPAPTFAPAVLQTSAVATNAYADSSPFGTGQSVYSSIGRLTGYYQHAAWSPTGSYSAAATGDLWYLASVFPGGHKARIAYQRLVVADTQATSGAQIATHPCPSPSFGSLCLVADVVFPLSGGRTADDEYWIFQRGGCVIQAGAGARHVFWAGQRATLVRVLGAATRAALGAARGACAPSAQPLSLSITSLAVQNARGMSGTVFPVNHQLTVVAGYTGRHLAGGYLAGSVHRWYYVRVNGQLRGSSTSQDSIIGVNGVNPPNRHTFTPTVAGSWRIVVRITFGSLSSQRAVDIRVVP